MTKLIALVALLAALAWVVTAAASRITAKKGPRALGRGKAPLPVTAAEQNRAFLLAQLRMMLAVVFTLAIFAAIFRFSVGISGQAGLTAVLTAQLSVSAGLLLFSALPAKKRTATSTESASTKRATKRSLALTAAIMLTFAAFITATGTAAPEYLPWQEGVPALLAALALAGSALLAGRRIASMAWFQDPRLAALDERWRRLSLHDLAGFTHGALLAGLGGTALLARLTMDSAQATSVWTTAGAAAGAALLAAGVVLVGFSVKGTLQLRARVREDTAAQRVSA